LIAGRKQDNYYQPLRQYRADAFAHFDTEADSIVVSNPLITCVDEVRHLLFVRPVRSCGVVSKHLADLLNIEYMAKFSK